MANNKDKKEANKINIVLKKRQIFRRIAWSLIILGFFITIILSFVNLNDIYSYIALGIMFIGLIIQIVNRYQSKRD